MSKVTKSFDAKKIVFPGLVAGVLMLVVGMVLTQVFNIVFPGLAQEYVNPELFRPWEDLLMMLFFAYPFVLGLGLSWFWGKSKQIFPGKTLVERAKNFAVSYFFIATIPGMFVTYSSFQVSLGMVLSWALSGLVDAFIAGYIFARMNA